MNTIQTLERYNDSLLVRYSHGDCDVISYDDMKILIADKNISKEIVTMMLECESKEDSEYIFNRIFNKIKEPIMQTKQKESTRETLNYILEICLLIIAFAFITPFGWYFVSIAFELEFASILISVAFGFGLFALVSEL